MIFRGKKYLRPMVDTDTPAKESPFSREWTQGSIVNNLLLLSWPMVLMETLFVVSQVADMVWIGRLGPDAIAGVGIANIVIMLVMSMDFGLIVGVRALVARYVGAGDIRGADHVAAQALLLSTAWGLLMMTIGITLSEPILSSFGLEPEVVTQGRAYMSVLFAGWVAMDILVMALYVVQSSGDAIRPMLIEVLIRIVHVTLCPFLVLGLWIFPPLGVRGAALSNIVSQTLGAILVLWLLFGGGTRLKITRRDFRFDPSVMVRILKIGIPALVMNFQRSFGQLALTWLIVPFKTQAVAAHTLASRVEMFVTMPGMGLGMGASVLVGQNLGAGQPARAEKSAWLATIILEAFMLAVSAAVLLWAEEIIGIFTTEPGLITMGGVFLRISAAAYAVMAFTTVLQNCISGAGDTVPNLIISIASIWLIMLPAAYILPRVTNLEVYGIRWAISIATVAGSFAYAVYFRSGRWKLKNV
jgi:putative MATE family efflux protein